ncbi:MAG: hypothetical protein QOJ15_8173 [Bradyrhizobium sp.]|nr:hypothetical protein [Bradyrhizobium sp.]
MMIVPAGVKVHLALGYTDMRKGMDGLAIGITPNAAAHFVTFDMPAYAEQVIAGNKNYALAYVSRDVNETRSE